MKENYKQCTIKIIDNMCKSLQKLEEEKNNLTNNKPLCFQILKKNIYKQKLAILDTKINFYLNQIEKELSML